MNNPAAHFCKSFQLQEESQPPILSFDMQDIDIGVYNRMTVIL